MDLNLLRSVATLMMFVLFIGIVVWAWGRQRQASFDDAAQLPFVDDARTRTPSGEQA
ncbi:MAG: CcoQ/FixQ family Cbb3-type cytochrome c oxidase assembly chaperone [Burkholderiales bacterium PBB5]|nr:MAG: CcoQ/FixQ family Cbb3-type cytochrome c oxidase assembly chaperone [Burkholderiales bacterium PBB5]